jgi:hypothetical protein
MGSIDEKKYWFECSMRSIGDSFADKFKMKWMAGKVGIMLENYFDSIYWMDRDEFGFPIYREFKTVEFSTPRALKYSDLENPFAEMTTVTEKSILIEKPMITTEYNVCRPMFSSERPTVYLWQGYLVNTNIIPMEKLEVGYLLKLTQEAIKKRECIIINEAQKNQLIK